MTKKDRTNLTFAAVLLAIALIAESIFNHLEQIK
jgi:hypothetical protein